MNLLHESPDKRKRGSFPTQTHGLGQTVAETAVTLVSSGVRVWKRNILYESNYRLCNQDLEEKKAE